MLGFISPYHGVQYHLKEQIGNIPNNRRELFNLKHSSLRSKIESTFGILKNYFKILSSKPNYQFETHVDIVLACIVLHNYIATVDPNDDILNEPVKIEEDDNEMANEDEDNILDFSQTQTQREQVESRIEWKNRRDQIAWEMWVDYYERHCDGNVTEIGMST
ncbi:uncharacterized protein LOC109839648 [Asparagus officinalis]|uniref:uncharacterized protein LOC109839648 n=1 Tax=Asparagus officinalis TaxID=4686 RepID=UPI00098E84F5|nr:uncharacterized protein LOC109839648 [Asparagus officinalis]